MNERLIKNKEKKRVALNSIFAAVFLTFTKLIVGIMTSSLGIISEAIHSGLDLVSALIAYFSVRVSDKPADSSHHYGHGKIEYLGAFTESILLLFTCIWILEKATVQMCTGKIEVESSVIGFVVMGCSILIDTWRTHVLNRVAKKYDSKALKAEALHFLSDIFSSLVVIIGLIFVSIGFKYADPVAAIVVAILVGIASIRLCKETIDVLLDKVPSDVEKMIKEKLSKMNAIYGFHKLRMRKTGKQIFIDFHITVDKEANISEVHTITDKISKELKSLEYEFDVTIHTEPETLKNANKKTEKEKKIIAGIVYEHKDIIVNFHNLMIHRSSKDNNVDLHLVLPKNLDIQKAHGICDHLESDIMDSIPNAKVNIHIEPCDDSCEKCNLTCQHRK